jgi:hypothetical protein
MKDFNSKRPNPPFLGIGIFFLLKLAALVVQRNPEFLVSHLGSVVTVPKNRPNSLTAGLKGFL